MDFSLSAYGRKLRLSALASLLLTFALAAVFVVPPAVSGGFGPGGLALSAAVLAAVFTCSFFLLTRKVRRRRRIVSRPFPPEWEEELDRRLPYFRRLTADKRERFKRWIQLFLGETKISGIGTEADDVCRLLVAASAIIPVFGYPEWEYDRLSEVLIYPSDFNENYEFLKQRRGFMGMVVSPSSTVILAKPALLEGYRRRRDGLNTGIHEFLHKVDSEDGSLDGVPSLLLDRETAAEWSRIAERERELIRRGRSDIDPYALDDPAEFFPVAGEYFFELPDRMASRHPELFRLLCRIFRQDPRE